MLKHGHCNYKNFYRGRKFHPSYSYQNERTHGLNIIYFQCVFLCAFYKIFIQSNNKVIVQSSPTTSSNGSLEAKDEINRNCTPESSICDESDEETKKFNLTYPCPNPNQIGDCITNNDIITSPVEESQEYENLKDDNENWSVENSIFKYRNGSSLSNNIDSIQWDKEFGDLNSGN